MPILEEPSWTAWKEFLTAHSYAFRSQPVSRAGGIATALYTTGTTPARTSGKSVDIWWIVYYNGSGGAATVWLESPSGTQISSTIQLANNQSVAISIRPLPVGDQNVYVNASANGVEAQIGGIEV